MRTQESIICIDFYPATAKNHLVRNLCPLVGDVTVAFYDSLQETRTKQVKVWGMKLL